MRENPASRAMNPVFLGAALLFLAFNLRTTVSSLPPLLSQVEADLRLTGLAAGLLTALPVLCMAWFAPVAHRLSHRVGAHATALGAVALVGVGNAIRGASAGGALDQGRLALYGGTVIAGIGVAVCGVVLPPIVRSHFPRHAGAASGGYSVAMMFGSSVAAVVAVPLDRWLGSWQASLATWGIPAFLAVAAWFPVTRRVNERAPATSMPPGLLPWRNGTAWLLASFCALQSSIAYAYIAWLAPAYEARGWSPAVAGALLGAMHLAQLPAAVALPAWSDRWTDRRPALIAAGTCSVIGAFWLLFLPDALPWVSASVLGLGLGGGFALALSLIVDYAADAGGASRLAAMAFFVGYNVASIVPAAAGALRDITGGFAAPWTMLAILTASQFVVATRLGASRRGSVGAGRSR